MKNDNTRYSESNEFIGKFRNHEKIENTDSYSESEETIRRLNNKEQQAENESFSESSKFMDDLLNGTESYSESKNFVEGLKNKDSFPKYAKPIKTETEKKDEVDDHHDENGHCCCCHDSHEEDKKQEDNLSYDMSDLRLVIKSEGQSTKTKERVTKSLHVVTLILTYAFLIVIALLFIFPFYWMIITSFKSGSEIKGFLPGYEGKQTFWPVQFTNNYANLTKTFNFGMYVGNTLIVGLCSTLGTLITCIFAAFAFARLKFKGKDLMFTLLLSTMMIPGEMMVVTNYISVSNFGWVNGDRAGAYLAMIVPFFISVFYIYLLRQNFLQIPNELYLAAKVDGKTDWQYLWKVMVPLAMPSLVTIFILKLMGSWNSYIWPNLVAGGHDEFKLVSNGLRDSFQTGSDFNEYGRQMAATVLVTLPLLLVFVLFRKYIMRGVSRAGIKG